MGWTLDPCTRLVFAPFNMFIMVDIYTVYHLWRSDSLKPLSKRHSFTTDHVVRFRQVNPLVKTKLGDLDAFPYLKIPMCYVLIWGKVVAPNKASPGWFGMLGYNWYNKEIRNTNLLKTIQLWLSYTLQNLHDILDLWPAKHSLKPSEKHRFLNAAATSFAVETSFAKFKWHSHQLHLGWVYETSSNAFLWVGKLVFKTLCKLELKCIQTYTFTLQICPEIASWSWSVGGSENKNSLRESSSSGHQWQVFDVTTCHGASVVMTKNQSYFKKKNIYIKEINVQMYSAAKRES